MSLEIETLALICQAVRYQSRRMAKRVLHENGLPHATAKQLDDLLAVIARHPQREEIEMLAESMQAAKMEANRQRNEMRSGTDLPEWLIGETTCYGRTFIIHNCPSGAYSFAGEVFSDESDCPDGIEYYPLDGGQILSNITWIDDRPLDQDDVDKLMKTARRELRKYDQIN